jgi:hypothetical protein
MRLAIIASAAIALIAGGTAIYGTIYGLLDGSAPSPEPTSSVEASKPDRAGLFAASDDVPRVRIGDLIILPPSEPDIVTGSINPGQSAKKAKQRKQTQTPKPKQAPAANTAARKPAPAPQQSNSSPSDLETLALTRNAE